MRSWENNKFLLTIRKHKLVFCFILIDIIAIIFVSFLSFQNHLKETEKTSVISFNVVPTSSKIYINQKLCKTTLCSVKPGSTEVKISYAGLKSKTYHLELKENTTTTINDYLNTPKEDFAFYLREDNVKHLDKLKDLSSLRPQDQKLNNFIAKYKILDFLPLEFEEYRDNYFKYIHFKIKYIYTDKNPQYIILKIKTNSDTSEADVLNTIKDKYHTDISIFQREISNDVKDVDFK